MSHALRRMQQPGARPRQITSEELPSFWLQDRLPTPPQQVDALILSIGDHQRAIFELVEIQGCEQKRMNTRSRTLPPGYAGSSQIRRAGEERDELAPSLDHLVGASEHPPFAERDYGTGRFCWDYSGLMFANLITLAHFSISAALSFP